MISSKRDGFNCPECGKTDIEGGALEGGMDSERGSIEMEYDNQKTSILKQRIICNTCGAIWDDWYKLFGYDLKRLDQRE